MKKSDLLQASAASSYEVKPQQHQQTQQNITMPSNAAAAFQPSTANQQPQQTLSVAGDSMAMEKIYGAQLTTLKLESQLSGSGAQQTSSLAKQLKIQQMYSDQASQAMQGHAGLSGASQTQGQGLLSVGQQAPSMGWERPENATSVTAAHQILQSRQQQMSTLSNQGVGVFTSRDPHLVKKHTALHHFEKQPSSSIFPSKDAATNDKSNQQKGIAGGESSSQSFNQMHSRSPHNSNFLKWGQQSTGGQKGVPGTNTPGSSLVSGVSLALKAHPISDSRRQHSNIGSQTGAQQVRGTAYQGSLWGAVPMLDAGNTQQRAAGKASGLTYTQNEHGLVEQSNRDPWKSDWLQSDEKTGSAQTHTQHSNIFFQAGKQRLKAMQSNFGAATRENFMGGGGPLAAQSSSGSARGQFTPFMSNHSQNNSFLSQSRALNLSKDEVPGQFNNTGQLTGGAGVATEGEGGKFMASTNTTNSGQNLGTGGASANAQLPNSERTAYSTKYRHPMEAQQPQPKLISNQSNQAQKRIQTRLNKGKQQLMQEGLQVMGFSRKQTGPGAVADQSQLQQSLQTTTGSLTVGPLAAESEDLLEMTPDIAKDKKQQRMVINNQSETGSSILKVTIPGKAHQTPLFLGSQEQNVTLTIQEQKRQATDGIGHHRRAESLGKHQKLTKLGSGKIEDPAPLEGIMHVKNWPQPKENLAAKKGKKSRHHKSFQGGMRPLKPYSKHVPPQTNSTTTSQLNDSGHGSGGNAIMSGLPAAHGSDSNNNIQVQNQSVTLSSEPGILQQSQKSSTRRQVMGGGPPTTMTGNNTTLIVHPMILAPSNNKARFIPTQQLSPAPNRVKPGTAVAAYDEPYNQPHYQHHGHQQMQQEMSEISGGQKRMKLLYQEFKDKEAEQLNLQPAHQVEYLAPPLSPKSIQRTPISGRKKSKKSKLVLNCDNLSGQQNPGAAAGIKTERFLIQQEHQQVQETAAKDASSCVKKESVKHRELKRIRHHNKLLSNPISSFGSQERDDGQPCQSSEEDNDEMFDREVNPQPGAHQLQMLQKQIHSSRDSQHSDETLSRDEGTANNAMEILEQVTPSGLATNPANQITSTVGPKAFAAEITSPTIQNIPREFTLDEDTAAAAASAVEVSEIKQRDKNLNLKEQQERIDEKKQMQPIQSRARLSMEQRGSGSLSKKQSSSDSSFQQTFEQLIHQSSGLMMQYEEILRSRLSFSDPVYSEFVDRILAKNKERQQKIFENSMPPQRRKEDFLENRFTSKRVVQHIEHQKKRQSEKLYRPFHSDMSRSRFLSNSLREDHPSITSPNLSGNAGASHLRRMQLHFNRHERKRRLHRYLSFNNGVTYHKSAQQASVLLPELSSGYYRNSLGHFGGRLFGISDSMSQRVPHVANDSNSSQKVTPIQQENKKLEDLQDATNRVKILPPPPANKQGLAVGDSLPQPEPVKTTAGPGGAVDSQDLKLIYEKLYMNDRKAQQMRAFLPLMKQQQSLKQENNFFRTDAADVLLEAPLAEEALEPPAASKKLYGKVIEWQMGNTLGTGTTGEVYEALNIDTGETFAVKMIKLMHPYLGLDQQKVKAVKKEIQRYKQLHHKHIVKYYDSEIIENNVLCIYLEYVYKSVAQMCREYGKIGEKNARMYTQQVLRALLYLHENNFVHGDLKGANVLVSQDGKEIKLCDMGNSMLLKQPQQATDLSASLNSVNSLVYSSPAWMAPETHMQKVGKRSDIWSLGCLVVEMLTGQNPWGIRLDGESNVHMALQRKLANRERPDIPGQVTPECRNFIDRCLQHDARQRPQARDLLDDPWIRNKEHSTIMSPRR